MNTYLAMASIHDDLLTPAVVMRANDKNDPTHNTQIHTISCESIEELLDLFLEKHGEECRYLDRYIYLYAMIDNKWRRITD